MGADADQDAVFRLERAVPVGGVRRLLRLRGIRIGQQRDHLLALHRIERLLRTMEDEDRPLPPADHDLRIFLDLADVEIDRPAGRERGGVGIHLVDQRHQGRRGADRADRRSGDEEEIAARRVRDRPWPPVDAGVAVLAMVRPFRSVLLGDLPCRVAAYVAKGGV